MMLATSQQVALHLVTQHHQQPSSHALLAEAICGRPIPNMTCERFIHTGSRMLKASLGLEAIFGRHPPLMATVSEEPTDGVSDKDAYTIRRLAISSMIQATAGTKARIVDASKTRWSGELLELKLGDLVELLQKPLNKDVSGWHGPAEVVNLTGLQGSRKIKARLVAQGFLDKQSTDTFAGTSTRWGQRLLIAVAVQGGWSLRSADISKAFLHGLTFQELHEEGGELREVQITLPPGGEYLLRTIQGYNDYDPGHRSFSDAEARFWSKRRASSLFDGIQACADKDWCGSNASRSRMVSCCC